MAITTTDTVPLYPDSKAMFDAPIIHFEMILQEDEPTKVTIYYKDDDGVLISRDILRVADSDFEAASTGAATAIAAARDAMQKYVLSVLEATAPGATFTEV